MNSLAAALVTTLALGTSASTQTGPWTDGELISLSSEAGAYKIFRVVPETGAVATLLSPLYVPGSPGSMAFDSHRGGLLANVSLAPDGLFAYRVWLVAHDGTAAALPGITGQVRALCPTGDGRIYFERHAAASQGPKPVEYFDASDQLHTLTLADGVTPFEIEVEHLLYDAPSNALIGSSSAWWALTDCTGTGGSVYRIPLSEDGSRVVGAVTCAPLATNGAEIMSLDRMPGGNVLATVSSGEFPSQSKLLSVDPVSLASSVFADPSQAEIEGGLWSARLGKAVVHAAWTSGYQMFTFGGGEVSAGSLLPTSQTVLGFGGYSPNDALFEVDLNGPACDGFQIPYGTGLAGKSGQVPLLGIVGCPDLGSVFTIAIDSVVGGANGILFIGLGQTSVPFKGGQFLVDVLGLSVPIAVGGVPGTPNAGSLAIPLVLTDPVFAGLDLFMQAGFVDAFAVHGVSLTNGVRMQGN